MFKNESEIKIKEKIECESFKEILNLQSKNDDTMWLIMNKLHEQRLKWKPHGRNFPILAFFFVNNESLVDLKVPHVMCYILGYSRLIGHVVLKQKTRLKKGLVS